jgi:hypothetical protein
MPLIILGLIVIIGALFLILTSTKNSSSKKSKIVNAPFKVKDAERTASPPPPGEETRGKVIHLYGDKKDENGE